MFSVIVINKYWSIGHFELGSSLKNPVSVAVAKVTTHKDPIKIMLLRLYCTVCPWRHTVGRRNTCTVTVWSTKTFYILRRDIHSSVFIHHFICVLRSVSPFTESRVKNVHLLVLHFSLFTLPLSLVDLLHRKPNWQVVLRASLNCSEAQELLNKRINKPDSSRSENDKKEELSCQVRLNIHSSEVKKPNECSARSFKCKCVYGSHSICLGSRSWGCPWCNN